MFGIMISNYLKHITPLRKRVRALRSSFSRRRDNYWVVEGKEKASQQPFRLFISGQLENRNYFADLIFDDSHAVTECSRTWKNKLLNWARAETASYDLAVIQTNTMPTPAALGPNGFMLPCWVAGEKNLREATELSRHSNHIKSDVRRIRKNRLDYRVTRDAAEFEHFYHTMYLPYLKKVYNDRALLMSYEEMQAATHQAELFLITQDNQDIAGGFLLYDESDRVRGLSLGVKDGDLCRVKAGALAAFEHLQTGYLLDKGYKRLHRGGSRPFLHDGALNFKKNRGMVITSYRPHWFAIIPLRDTASVRAFLQNNPFIYDKDGMLKGAIFSDSEAMSEDSVSRVFRDNYIAGLDSLVLFTLKPGQKHDLSILPSGKIDSSRVFHPGDNP